MNIYQMMKYHARNGKSNMHGNMLGGMGGTFTFAMNNLHRLPSVGILKGVQGLGKVASGRKAGVPGNSKGSNLLQQ